MKKLKSAKNRELLRIGATAAGEVYVADGLGHFWMVPNEAVIDTARLGEDCRSICRGTLHTSYLDYVGMYDLDQMEVGDEEYDRFIGASPFGKFEANKSGFDLVPMFAGPENLRRFGAETAINKLPESIANFHTETARVCRKLIYGAAKQKGMGNLSGWQFLSVAAQGIQDLKTEGIMEVDIDDSIWSQSNVWEILVQLCRRITPNRLMNAFLLCDIAHDLDGVYVPVPEDVAEYLQRDPNTLDMLFRHEARAPKAGSDMQDGEPGRNDQNE